MTDVATEATSVVQPAEEASVAALGEQQSRTRRVIGAIVSVLSIAGCAWWASTQDAPTFPNGAGNIALLAAGVVVYAVATLVRGARWDAILRYLKVRHARIDAYALTVVGYMGNTVLPARGGEVLRIFLLAERSHALRREAFGSILTERLLDAGALAFLFVALTITGTGDAPGGTLMTIVAAGALVGAVALAFLYLRLRIAGKLVSLAQRVRPITRASRQLLTGRGAVLFTATVCVWALEGVIFWLGVQALDVPLGLLDGVVVVVLASLSALIPAGPGYVGTYDAAALLALHHLGVHGGAAVSCILLFRFVVFVPITLAGLLVMLARYGGLRGAIRRERAADVGVG